MADQLFEIANVNLTKTQLGTGADHTLLTTDANTSYVIKDLYVSSSSAIPVSLTMKVNNVSCGTFTDSASGSEIIPPNSVVKVASSTFPLKYQDFNVTFYDESTTYGIRKFSEISVAGIIDPALSGNSFTSITSFSGYTSWGSNYTIKFLNPAGTRLISLAKDDNSYTRFAVESTTSSIFENTASYTPKVYDGRRYVYWYESQYVRRYDVTSNSASDEVVVYVPANGQTTYSRSWVSSGLNEAFMFNSGGSSSNAYAMNTTTYSYWNMGTFNNKLYGTNCNIAASWDAANNQYTVAMMVSSNQCEIFTVKVGATAVFQKTISIPLSVPANSGSFYMEDRKIIFMSDDNLYSVDVDSLGSAKLLTVGSGNHSNNTFIYSKSTPSAETIAARTYSIDPTFSVRAVGIKIT